MLLDNMKQTQQLEMEKEAIAESVAYFSKDDYQQNKTNETLAKILEIVRDQSTKNPTLTAYAAMNQIVRMFPE